MQTRDMRIALALFAFSVFTLFATTAVAADDSLEELLIDKGFITQDELDAAREEAAAQDAKKQAATPETPSVFEAAPEEKPKVEVTANHKGLIVTSPNGDFVFGFGGRMQWDFGGFSGGLTPLGGGTELRRGRIKSFGTVYSDWDFKLEVNFDTNGEVSVTDGWIRYSGFKPITITVGHQKVPFGQQSMTSSNWQVFQERALTDGFIDTSEEGRRRVGAVVGSYGSHWNFYTGVFGEGINAPTANNEDWGVAARGVVAPIIDSTHLVMVSGSIYYRQFESNSMLRYAIRPEAHLASSKLVDTGVIYGTLDDLMYNASASFVWGPFHAQGEYTGSSVNRFIGLKDLWLDGWYVQGGFFITGESRNYDIKSGQFKGIKPAHKYGAWEIAARFSTLDLQDEDVLGGREKDVTAGLNWWVNQNVMLRFNYVHAWLSPNSIVLAPPFNGVNEQVNAYMGRVQIVF